MCLLSAFLRHKGPINRVSSEGSARTTSKQRYFVLLHGSLEFDGRAKRMIQLLCEDGQTTLVDIQGNERTTTQSGEVSRIRIPISTRNKKWWKHLHFWGTSLRQALRVEPTTIVAENFLTCFPGWVAAKITEAKFVYDAYELIIPEPGQIMNLRDRFWYLLERWCVKRADLLIAANEERACLMAEHYQLERTPEIMLNIPVRTVMPADPDTIITKYPAFKRRTQEDRLLLYQGDINLARGIGKFINAMNFLSSSYRLIVIGSGPDLRGLAQIARPLSRKGRIFLLGRIEHNLLPSLTPLADIGIICYPFTGQNNIYCSPNKLFEYAQAGLPIVATNQPFLQRIISKFKLGGLIEEGHSPEQIAQILQDIAEHKVFYKEGLAAFVQSYKWEDEAARLRKAIRFLGSRPQ